MTPEAKAREIVESLIDSLKEQDTWLPALTAHRERIQSALQAERDKVDRLKVALEFYAVPGVYECEDFGMPHLVSGNEYDYGKRAQAALKEVEL